MISLACLHNLRTRNDGIGNWPAGIIEEAEQFNLECWALTAESILHTSEWIWLYNHFGYTGDYEFIYFE